MNLSPNNPYRRGNMSSYEAEKTTFSVPMADFNSVEDIEFKLETEEMIVARFPNTKPTGYTHHIALVYKMPDGTICSTGMFQKNGDIKEGTLEALEPKQERPFNNRRRGNNRGKKNKVRQFRNETKTTKK